MNFPISLSAANDDPRESHSDGHLDQDKSGRPGGKPGQGGTDAEPARSGQLTEDPRPERDHAR
ncbi:hypothetical protein [Arenimonas sp. MALMAid1274]|uniref:hypothetical protein n=1 Tax=Arenimonas sp. MALMAid1274 TaxID=3411630 RepID=UPI003BA29953